MQSKIPMQSASLIPPPEYGTFGEILDLSHCKMNGHTNVGGIKDRPSRSHVVSCSHTRYELRTVIGLTPEK